MVELLSITTLQRLKFRQFKSQPELNLSAVICAVLSMETQLAELILLEWRFTKQQLVKTATEVAAFATSQSLSNSAVLRPLVI